MVGLLLLGKGNASQQRAYTGIQLQTSAQGIAVPVYYGTSRQTDNLVWYKHFRAVQTGSGGKGGLAAQAAGKGTGNQYNYYADVILGVCEGPIEGFGQAWASKTPTTISALGFTEFLGTYPQAAWGYVTTNYPSEARPYTGLAYLAEASYQLGSGAELPMHTFEVYGVYSQRSVYTSTNIPGSGPFTVTVGRRTWADGSTVSLWVANVSIPGFVQVGGAPGAGQYSVAAGVYTFNAANAGAAITIQWTGDGQDADPSLVVADVLSNANYGIGYPSAQVGALTVYTESGAIPGGLHQITVTHTSGFDDNLSVYESATDTLFTCVASSPGALQYSYAAGVYTFNVADLGKTVDISYSANAGLTTYQSYCYAAGFFISPAFRTQAAGSGALDAIARFTNSEVVVSAGAIKLVPRGDQALSANGHTYTPPSPAIDLDDDDFLSNQVSGGASGGISGDDPVILTRRRQSDQKNVVQVECLDRSNQYNSAVVEATDQAMVDLYGRRTTGSEQGHLFCDTTTARASAQLLLQRQAIRNTYGFVLPETFIYLDPMDLVTLTDTRLGLSTSDWQRITSIEEQDDGRIHVIVEESTTGTASADSYNFGQGSGYAANYNADPGNVNTPVIFEPPVQLATNSGLEMWCAVSGANSFWGGCDIYVSSDNVTYNFVGRKWGQSRMGLLTSGVVSGFGFVQSLFDIPTRKVRQLGHIESVLNSTAASRHAPAIFSAIRRDFSLLPSNVLATRSPDPDTASTISVNLTESFGELVSATTADADAGNTLCIVDAELFSFSTVVLTATYNYNLTTYIRRGMFGTNPASHAVGAIFARLDENIFVIPWDKSQLGNTVYVKFCSFNLWGGGLQDLSSVTAYTHTIGGPPTPAAVQNFTAMQIGLAVALHWTDIDDASVRGYDIYYGAQGAGIGSATLLSQASRTTETTTVAVGTGNWTFYIQARNIADQVGPVTSVNITITELSQIFTQNGTWIKPASIQTNAVAHIQIWGGGGGGGSGAQFGGTGQGGGAGGGGAYVEAWLPLSGLPATVPVTVGQGGAGGIVEGSGGAGGLSSFGALLSAYGGGGGGYASDGGGGGGGGGLSGPGGTVGNTEPGGDGGLPSVGGGETPPGGGGQGNYGAGGGDAGNDGGDAIFGGAGGGGAVTGGFTQGGGSVYGGAGGSGGNVGSLNVPGGLSVNGGAGGAGGAGGGLPAAGPGGAGQIPGGGGGGGGYDSSPATRYNGGAGGGGKVTITIVG